VATKRFRFTDQCILFTTTRCCSRRLFGNEEERSQLFRITLTIKCFRMYPIHHNWRDCHLDSFSLTGGSTSSTALSVTKLRFNLHPMCSSKTPDLHLVPAYLQIHTQYDIYLVSCGLDVLSILRFTPSGSVPSDIIAILQILSEILTCILCMRVSRGLREPSARYSRIGILMQFGVCVGSFLFFFFFFLFCHF